MVVKMNSIARGFSVLAIIVTVLSLNSCLSLDTEIKLRKDGTVDAILTYVISPDAADFGRGFGSDEPWPLPLTEKDFQQQSLKNPDVELRRYRNRISSEGIESIEVKLKAESIEALVRYLGIDLEITQANNSGTLVLKIPVTDEYENADEDTRRILDEVAGSSVFSFSFQPPSSPSSVNIGLIDRRKAIVEFSLIDLLNGNGPDSWEVSW